MNKDDLPLMYSCVFWYEFIDLVDHWLHCVTHVTPVIIYLNIVKTFTDLNILFLIQRLTGRL